MSEELVVTYEEELKKSWFYWLNSFIYEPSTENEELKEIEEKFSEKNHGDLKNLDFHGLGYYEDDEDKNVKVFVPPKDDEESFYIDDENYIMMDFYKI